MNRWFDDQEKEEVASIRSISFSNRQAQPQNNLEINDCMRMFSIMVKREKGGCEEVELWTHCYRFIDLQGHRESLGLKIASVSSAYLLSEVPEIRLL